MLGVIRHILRTSSDEGKEPRPVSLGSKRQNPYQGTAVARLLLHPPHEATLATGLLVL